MILYNQNLKERFLSGYKKNTSKTYSSDLSKVSESEFFYNKDIFNFTHEQILEMLKGLQTKKAGAASRMISTLKKYTKWANQQGYIPTKIDPLSTIDGDYVDNIVWKHALENSFIDREQMYDVCDKLVNPQDRLTVVCPFEGIKGKELIEIRTLKFNNCFFSHNFIEIRNNKNNKLIRRIENVDERSMKIIEDAYKNKEYYPNNGRGTGVYDSFELFPTEYLVKKCITPKISENCGEDIVGFALIESRITQIFKGKVNKKGVVIKEAYVDYPFLNINNLYKSGFFDYCKTLEDTKEVLTTECYKKACVRFGINTNLWNSYKKQYVSYKNLKK